MFEPANPVLTLGRRAASPDGRIVLASTIAASEEREIAVIEADRGGLATLHLPGQLVVFLALPPPTPPIRSLVVELLRSASDLAQQHGIEGAIGCDHDAGLWQGTTKLASIGLRIRRRAVQHGMSINVAIDVRMANGLTLCGHRDRAFGSLQTPDLGGDVTEQVHDAAVSVADYLRLAPLKT